MGEEILVSVVCITYNHEEYIKDALNGILMQNVDFKYEIIVHDDASTDKTPQIIKAYEKEYPHIFRCVYQSFNQFSSKGGAILEDVLNLCRGRYIAFCEGDDFWIDRHKLQIQIDWMEEHPDYDMTVHNALMVNYMDNTLKSIDPLAVEKEASAEEIIMKDIANFPTASIVVRSVVKNIPSFFWECGVGDIPIQMYCMNKGKVYYFDRIMSVFRYLHKGSWSASMYGQNNHKHGLHYIEMMRFAERFDEYSEKRFHYHMDHFKIQHLFYLFNVYNDLPIADFRNAMYAITDKSSIYLTSLAADAADAFEQFYNEKFLSPKLKTYVNGFHDIYIWGTGQYGTKLARQFTYNRVEYRGFIVSDDFVSDECYMDKRVYHISDVKALEDDSCIIGAMNPALWREIQSVLDEMGFAHYHYLFFI